MTLLLFAYIFNIFDYVCTCYWIKRDGISVEANPFGRWMFTHNVAWLFKIVIAGACFGLLMYYYNQYAWLKYPAFLVFVVYFALAVYHIYLLMRFAK